ncbi:IS4 family transposase [Streptomyces mirabilis]|uniref:IS4 family transposase n=1 Tax=Streptomyces mirabilis TaxID=68239 RepID=A0ABU3V5M9_9ACTN|nr:IS4 family transposase [Streptomyces mirabilis]MCX5355835.1 IS4 family transposase [Streptomyces mirabilis]MDU9001476.1 IS4 family transposase [Streptomyces mirabilis]
MGELTQVIDPQLVDAVLEETGTREQRVRLLPARVVVYFVLALVFFERSSYRAVWNKLGTGLCGVAAARPCASSLSRARRRLGSAPLHRLFEILAGPVATRAQTGSFYRGLRVVAVDGTTLSIPDEETVTWHFPKHCGPVLEFGYPLLRLVALVECGTRGELGYARQLLDQLDASMVLLADAYYDAFDFLHTVTGTGASFLMRSTRKRRPTMRHPLPDGSYLTTICAGKYQAGRGYGRLDVRIVEARMTVTLTDGTRRTELWRLITSLLDADRYPAHELIALYHRRWQAETCYFSLKSTILDGRVLRSRTVPGIEQEVYALLTVYQALVRIAGDVLTAQPGLPAERVSLTVLLNASADQIVAARGIAPTGPVSLIGVIGCAALADLLPLGRRWRLKARVRKRNSKYTFTAGKHPRNTQTYTLAF